MIVLLAWWWGAPLSSSWYCHFIPLFSFVLCLFFAWLFRRRRCCCYCRFTTHPLCTCVCMTQSSTVTIVSWIIYNIMYACIHTNERGYSRSSKQKNEQHRNFLRGSFFTSSTNNNNNNNSAHMLKEEWPILKIFLLFFIFNALGSFFVDSSCVRALYTHYIHLRLYIERARASKNRIYLYRYAFTCLCLVRRICSTHPLLWMVFAWFSLIRSFVRSFIWCFASALAHSCDVIRLWFISYQNIWIR